MSGIKKGNPVEFTDDWYQNYPPADTSLIRYGIAVEDNPDVKNVKVAIAGGRIVTARHIHAYAWIGWIPEELDEVYNLYNPDDYYDDYGN